MVQKTFEPTDEQRKQVEAMKGYGVPEPDIHDRAGLVRLALNSGLIMLDASG